MSRPLVSVVLSVYNGEKYLDEAIISILEQTYEYFEFIIIDDGSTDGSLEIIKSYDDKRIVLINRENKGLIASLNEGIKKAKGKYIVRMDADDIALPKRIEIQVKFMEANPDIGISGSAVIVFGENIKTFCSKPIIKNEIIKCELLFSSAFVHPSVIIRRRTLVHSKIQYNDEFIHAEDFELWVHLSKITIMANISEPLLKYRVVENSITREANKNEEERYLIHKRIFKSYLNMLKVQNTDKENRLHFYVAEYKRIKEDIICFNDLEKYFDKLLRANQDTMIFNHFELKKVLGKKWIVNIYYRKNIYKVFSKYFLYGVLGLINKWIR